jgi:putative tryptophan/tyrosine transport system substrate-binding protein
MRRREFIGGFVGSLVLSSAASRAQLPSKRRISIVAPSRPIEDINTNPIYRAFLDELARLGFAEGQNLVIDRYSGGSDMDGYPELARKVVSDNPEAILTSAGPMTIALRAATRSIPIVTIIGDPVVWGLATSLARPGPFTRDTASGFTSSLPCIFVGVEAASSRHGSRGGTSI